MQSTGFNQARVLSLLQTVATAFNGGNCATSPARKRQRHVHWADSAQNRCPRALVDPIEFDANDPVWKCHKVAQRPASAPSSGSATSDSLTHVTAGSNHTTNWNSPANPVALEDSASIQGICLHSYSLTATELMM